MNLAHFLLGQSRSAVLGALFLRPEAALHVRELARLTGVSPGSLHRELRALAEMGLLIRQETGRQVYYRANQQCPVYQELTGLLRKTAGLVDVLRERWLPLAGQIEQAFVYGSLARGDEHAHSDVDLMIIGTWSSPTSCWRWLPRRPRCAGKSIPPCCRALNSSASCRTPKASWPKCGAAPSCGWWARHEP